MPTSEVVANFQKQYDFYKSKHEGDQKFRARTITMFNRLALVLEDDVSTDAFASYQAGGLLNQVRPPILAGISLARGNTRVHCCATNASR